MSPSDAMPTVLIADDSDILNNMLKEVFEENGFDVIQAFDGMEAKAAFLKHDPDLAFIDVQMPKSDGIQALRYIKERSQKTIVVMMTGMGNEEVAVRAMKLGAEDYITKPFGTKDIILLAHKLLEHQRLSTETAKLESDIRKNEKYLAHLTMSINEALITTDLTGKIQFANTAATTLWGYSLDELRLCDVHLLIRGEGGPLLRRDLVRDTMNEGKIEGEFIFRKNDNSSFPGYLSTSVLLEGEKVKGIVLVVADLTRLYEVERRLRQSQKLASLGRVVEGIAHEVRNSLASLGGFAKRLRKVTEGDEKCRQYTGYILDDVKRLEKMVKDIEEYVNFSKLYTFNFKHIQLGPIIEEARNRANELLPPERLKKLSFSLKVPKGIRPVQGDAKAVEQIFYNLIMNSYEAMPDGGRLTVQLENKAWAVAVTLTDSGVGIPQEDLDEIFTPFFTSKTTGAGMGLSKVYLLVEAHGGQIHATSVGGKGAVFEVSLPFERSQSLFSR